ncbi:uncharacterized protein SPSK_04547 [Sporothrix schenckii 1099-18]|uniref:CFEM domain-containing protein n=2 Tax=Sporothrix schenckii TaxID=29908 RepID=U7PT71_SPOS1|nr:uncharacterized protein SPSK_04547 [Sporothrix schenckii 1099-18]ERS98843.1 hypothetical protein HMPREF1624_04033 [Sporothrix schenckii ATCC 58251]KJR83555.1 hypothetical protein SPSK_04547 [Sporothrix schenckii 1099-18]
MKPRTATTEIGRRRRLIAASTVLFFAAAASAADATTPTTTGGDGTATGTATTSAGTINVTGTTVPQLVTESEPCALLCYNAACLDSGCSPGDFACVCGNPHSLVVKMGLCVGKDCDDARQFDSGQWMADLCSAFAKQDQPSSVRAADLVSASSVIVAEISSAAATATNNPVPSTGTISNGDNGETAAAGASGTASASAGRPRLLHIGAGGLLGLTSVAVGLVGGAAVLAAAVL